MHAARAKLFLQKMSVRLHDTKFVKDAIFLPNFKKFVSTRAVKLRVNDDDVRCAILSSSKRTKTRWLLLTT